MNTSVLNDIKKLLGIDASQTAFDQDIIIYINGVLMTLSQIGICERGVSIFNENNVWSEVIDDEDLELVKSYIYMKVRMIFDPPSSSAVMESMNKMIAECEWRLNSRIDYDT